MPKLPRVSGAEAQRALKRLGFVKLRQRWTAFVLPQVPATQFDRSVVHGIHSSHARGDDRVYCTERKGVLIVLLAGGDKSSQQKDIEAALALARGLLE